jgi:hypothetical protein
MSPGGINYGINDIMDNDRVKYDIVATMDLIYKLKLWNTCLYKHFNLLDTVHTNYLISYYHRWVH